MAGYAIAAGVAAALWFGLAHLQNRARVEILYQGLGRALADYAEDHNGMLPPLDVQSGRLMFADTDLVPTYINANVYREAIGEPGSLGFLSLRYYYPGYVLLNDKEVAALASALSSRATQSHDGNGNLLVEPGAGNLGGNVIYRLGSDALSHLASSDLDRAKLAGRTPVLIARTASAYWRHRRFLVLFLDNHVEERQYPGDFPLAIGAQAAFVDMESELSATANGGKPEKK